MIGRIHHAADFKMALATRSRARSEHFAVHFVPSSGKSSCAAMLSTPPGPSIEELSTATPFVEVGVVDDRSATTRLGAVVPKRYARRATTRNLLKRQIRITFAKHHPQLPQGMWVLRLRAPFDADLPDSAQSLALRRVARTELDLLLSKLSAVKS